MIDIVYALGKGSTWDNNELRYSLRSIEKHLKNYGTVWIIGEHPDWITNVNVLPMEDLYHPSRNIMEKILRACRENNITNEFLFMNDDLFLLQDIDAPTYPYYYDKMIASHFHLYSNNWYNQYIEATELELCLRSAMATKYFDVHTPIRYDKKAFKEVVEQFDFNKKLLVKSIYCNTMNIPGEQLSDCKIKGWRSEAAVKAMINGRHVFSTGDQCLVDSPTRPSAVKTLLGNLFPDKSKYEL